MLSDKGRSRETLPRPLLVLHQRTRRAHKCCGVQRVRRSMLSNTRTGPQTLPEQMLVLYQRPGRGNNL